MVTMDLLSFVSPKVCRKWQPTTAGSLCLLLCIGLLASVSAVGPGGEALAGEGCEEYVANSHSNDTESFEILTVNFAEVSTPLAITIWILIAAVAKVLFHYTFLPKYVPESCLLIAVGFVIGGLFQINSATVFNAQLSTHLFFLYLLPPIMMEAGYFMPMEAFFGNFGSIMMFAVIGTLINSFTIGLSLWGISEGGILGENVTVSFLECMTFSSLISAVDPVAVLAVFEEIHVNQFLHILVFGESLFNDAVTVVLYRVFESFNEIGAENLANLDIFFGFLSFFVVALGGILVGLIFGLLTAFISKYTYKVRVIEPIFVFVMAYLSYIIAEMLTLSSILAIVVCAMFMKPYVEQNISRKSHTTIKYFLKMLSSVSETIIFIFLGTTSLESKGFHQWNTVFVVFTLIFCSVYRCIGVYLQVKFLNYFRLFKINRRSQFIMAYGGIRGAIAFSLVALLCEQVIPNKRIFFTTTVVVIMFTVFIQGITIKPLVGLLHVKRAEKRKPTMNEEIHERFNEHLMTGIEDIIGHHGHYSFKEKWLHINENYLEKYLVRERTDFRNQKIIEVYKNLAQKDALELVNDYKPVPSVASMSNLLALSRKTSEASMAAGPTTLEVPSESTLRQRRQGEEREIEEAPEREGLDETRRNSSFTVNIEAFKKHAFAPMRTHTVRQSRYFLDEEETENHVHHKQPQVGRSLHILARHKTKKMRTTKGAKKSSGGVAGLLRKNKSGASIGEDRNGLPPTIERPESGEEDVNITAPPGTMDIEVTPPQVKFSIEDEEDCNKEDESKF